MPTFRKDGKEWEHCGWVQNGCSKYFVTLGVTGRPDLWSITIGVEFDPLSTY